MRNQDIIQEELDRVVSSLRNLRYLTERNGLTAQQILELDDASRGLENLNNIIYPTEDRNVTKESYEAELELIRRRMESRTNGEMQLLADAERLISKKLDFITRADSFLKDNQVMVELWGELETQLEKETDPEVIKDLEVRIEAIAEYLEAAREDQVRLERELGIEIQDIVEEPDLDKIKEEGTKTESI